MPTFEPASKPTLESVLDHYGISYRTTRGGQKIRCPIHDDRKPSCSLDLSKGLINCQSCDFGSDSWGLIQAMEGNCDFKQAVAIADKLGFDRVDAADAAGNAKRRGPARARSSLVASDSAVAAAGAGYVPSWRRVGR